MASNTFEEDERPTWLPDGYIIVTERPAELPADWTVIAKTNDSRSKRYLSPTKTTKYRYMSQVKAYKKEGPSMEQLCGSLSRHGSDSRTVGSSIMERHHRLSGEVEASEEYIGWLSGRVSELQVELDQQNAAGQNDGA